MKLLGFFMCFILSIGYTQAQQLNVTGTVTDNRNLPLPGVSVIIKGTTKGIQTDFDGVYNILVNKGDTLVFSYVGFATKEIQVIASGTIDVTLEVSASELEEVVVTGYAAKRQKHSLGYSVSTITASSIKKSKRRRKVRALRGRAAGVVISKGNQKSRGNSNVIIRGTSSVDRNKQPLFVVDGVVMSKKDMAGIQAMDPSKIKSINVLKGKSASSIYGAKANNGVVVVTTHTGKFKIEDNESYTEIEENTFKHVQTSPLSTFSIDVDKASYSNIRRMINNGTQVPQDAVKVEEMINYFDYDYAQPTGEHPMAIHTEYGQTPWNQNSQLVKIGLKGKEVPKSEIPASNLIFLIDVSGSMGSENKLPLLKKAFSLLVKELREKDKVSIVVYAGAAGLVLEPTSGANKTKIINALDRLESGGATAGGEGIALAYKVAQENFIKEGNNRVILTTDGDFNVGMSSDTDMKRLIEEKRKSGVFLTCLGFGMGNYKDSKLETLADKGNGNHAYIDTMQEAQRVLVKEFGGTLYTIAKDVKIQVEFNPSKVKAYRLIGYENRLLNDEDFVDDTKDAGELGSGHTVTALYEIIPAGVQSEFVIDIPNLKYTRTNVKTGFGNELLTVKFRYKKPSKNKSIEMVHIVDTENHETTHDFNFAASVAWFGMKLRNSKYIKNQKVEDIISLAKSNKNEDKEGYRSEFVCLMSSYIDL
ncbi:VWA domain-containing protein [Aquimarina spongiae]|uniref:Ca-activated chloride channel family protein n=1 Tax=Aquimarina spongiae TaxID=570521 RepID=A0A1M6BDN2_9FLAO|nr:VWA domain-containing protein [Aquimarina spongiae]SHI46796.1 Ca-activated chloride channel family protein [Aquimarina spongiae]